MKKKQVFVDAGHGGTDLQGRYTTRGKYYDHIGLDFRHDRMNPYRFCEGVFNRAVADKYYRLLKINGYDAHKVYHSYEDTPLWRRTSKANNFNNGRSLYVSIHGNASSKTSANGFEIFTSKGKTKSDPIATMIHAYHEAIIGQMYDSIGLRADLTDGDIDKEYPFYVLRSTRMPAVLIEYGFFTNRAMAKLMAKESYQKLAAEALFAATEASFDYILK